MIGDFRSSVLTSSTNAHSNKNRLTAVFLCVGTKCAGHTLVRIRK